MEVHFTCRKFLNFWGSLFYPPPKNESICGYLISDPTSCIMYKNVGCRKEQLKLDIRNGTSCQRYTGSMFVWRLRWWLLEWKY